MALRGTGLRGRRVVDDRDRHSPAHRHLPRRGRRRRDRRRGDRPVAESGCAGRRFGTGGDLVSVTPEALRAAMARFATGVTVLTTEVGGLLECMTANAV